MHLGKSFKIFAIPLFSDNYSYIVKVLKNSALLLIDPADPKTILDCLDKYFNDSTVNHILYTHKHWDHAGGAKQLRQILHKKNSELRVYAGNEDAPQIDTVTNSIMEDSLLQLKNQGIKIQVYKVPCHTRGHVIYKLTNIYEGEVDPDKKQQPVMRTSEGRKIWQFETSACCFTGDTLFSGGVGKFFEGNASQMFANLKKINQKLPVNCPIFNGHEYTVSNLKWSAKAEPQNQDILFQLQRIENLTQPICSIPTSLQKQRKINLFLRAVSQKTNKFNLSGEKYLHLLRETKNNGITNLAQYLENI